MTENIGGIHVGSTGKFTSNKTLALIAVFSASAIVLHIIPLRVPFPILPFLFYEFWEVPIVAAFLLFGSRVGLSVALINALSLFVVFPGSIPAGPFYNLVAILSMIFPILVIYHLAGKRIGKKVFTLALISGICYRILFMTVFNGIMLPLPAPLGFEYSIVAVKNMLPALGIFNGSIALYIIPISHIISRTVSRTL